MRRQRRQAIRFVLVILVPILVLPLLFAAVPGLSGIRLGPMPPLAWLILGPVLLTSIIVVAAVNERAASRREDRWVDRHDRNGR